MDVISSKKKKQSYEITPGAWRITPQEGLIKMDLIDFTYYETDSSKELMKHFEVFRKNINTYRKRNIPPKRGFLFGSEPGVGKSSLINFFCRQMNKLEKICILRIDSDEVSFETITDMFMASDASKVDFIVLVIEDIGGSGLDQRAERVDPSMLNFLDGNSDLFKIPTMIVATTNYLDSLNKTLTSRPGRFDIVREVERPKDEEIIWLVEKFIERKLNDSEKEAFKGTKMTPAYSKEAVLRHELYDMPLEKAVEELLEQRKKAEESSHRKSDSRLGFNYVDDDF